MSEATGLIERGRHQLAIGEAESAAAYLARAAEAEPAGADLYCDLAVALHRAGQPERALEACRHALAIEPDHGAVHLNLSSILRELDRLEDAVDHANRAEMVGLLHGDEALAIDARFNRGQALLGLGEAERGWRDWDARLALPLWQRFGAQQRWDGSPLHGRSLVVRREQGLGDELFFLTCYAALVDRAKAADGGPVLIECDARLLPALSRSVPGAQYHAIDTVAGRAAALARQPTPPAARRAPPGDLWVAAGSLPGLLGLPLPGAARPALAVDPDLALAWRRRIAAIPGKGPAIGLCWRSGVAGGRRNRHQAAIEDFDALLRLPEARFVSLQLGVTAEEQAHAEAASGRTLHDFEDLDLGNDLEQAMALLASLDLVVSVGTWIVPMAGLAGTPVAYLASLRDYWSLGGGTLPWFANARRYAAVDGDFAAAAARVAASVAGEAC